MKTKLIVGILLLVWAILLSGLAGLVSIVGMMALFPAGGLTIIAIMTLLESSKLLVAGWTHANWKNPHVPRWLKTYMVSAVITLMAITGMGVYGFMTKAHLEQNAPTAAVQINIDQKQTALAQLVAQREQLQTQQTQINSTVTSYLETGKAAGAGSFIRQQRAEQARIQGEIKGLNDQITAGNVELAPLKQEMAGSEAKLGPLKAVADLFGWKDASAAVKTIILMLMWCFDPLAVATMVAGTIAIGEYQRMRRERSMAAPESDIEVIEVIEYEDDEEIIPDDDLLEDTDLMEDELGDDTPVDEYEEEPEMELSPNWLNWTEADRVVDGPLIREEHRAGLDPIVVPEPVIVPLPEVEPILMSMPDVFEDSDFESMVVPSPAPKFGGIAEPTPDFFPKMVQEPVDETAEKIDNTAVLISILENDPDLMTDLINAITSRSVAAAPVVEPTPEPESDHDARARVWLEPRPKDE